MVQRTNRPTTGRTLGQAAPPDSVVEAIARAIATAEGFFSSSGTALPQRANNPGDLMLGDIGFGVINGKTIYKTAEDGWNALYNQVRLMLTGASAYYNPQMTIREIAVKYTGNDNPVSWAMNVAQSLGVSIETRLGDLVGGVLPPPSATTETVAMLIVGGLILYLVLR